MSLRAPHSFSPASSILGLAFGAHDGRGVFGQPMRVGLAGNEVKCLLLELVHFPLRAQKSTPDLYFFAVL